MSESNEYVMSAMSLLDLSLPQSNGRLFYPIHISCASSTRGEQLLNTVDYGQSGGKLYEILANHGEPPADGRCPSPAFEDCASPWPRSLGWWTDGMNKDEILQAFPDLGRDDIQEAPLGDQETE